MCGEFKKDFLFYGFLVFISFLRIDDQDDAFQINCETKLTLNFQIVFLILKLKFQYRISFKKYLRVTEEVT